MRASVATLAAVFAFALSGCGGGHDPAVRIGVLADCTGGLAAFNDRELASAALPLLVRGARLAGA